MVPAKLKRIDSVQYMKDFLKNVQANEQPANPKTAKDVESPKAIQIKKQLSQKIAKDVEEIAKTKFRSGEFKQQLKDELKKRLLQKIFPKQEQQGTKIKDLRKQEPKKRNQKDDGADSADEDPIDTADFIGIGEDSESVDDKKIVKENNVVDTNDFIGIGEVSASVDEANDAIAQPALKDDGWV